MALVALIVAFFLFRPGRNQQRMIKLLMNRKKGVKNSQMQEQFLANMSHEIRTTDEFYTWFYNSFKTNRIKSNAKEYI